MQLLGKKAIVFAKNLKLLLRNMRILTCHFQASIWVCVEILDLLRVAPQKCGAVKVCLR
jgi:hypothetical protein